jgi:hypothetical protein
MPAIYGKTLSYLLKRVSHMMAVLLSIVAELCNLGLIST